MKERHAAFEIADLKTFFLEIKGFENDLGVVGGHDVEKLSRYLRIDDPKVVKFDAVIQAKNLDHHGIYFCAVESHISPNRRRKVVNVHDPGLEIRILDFQIRDLEKIGVGPSYQQWVFSHEAICEFSIENFEGSDIVDRDQPRRVNFDVF